MFGHSFWGTRYFGGRYFGDGGAGAVLSFPSGWQRKCAITIDATKVGSGGVTDFTVLLTRSHFPNEMVSPTSLNNAQSDGGDIRFSSDAAGVTRLAAKVDTFGYDTVDAAGDGTVQIHVKVPSLSSASNTTIYVWYSAISSTSQPVETDTYGGRNAWDAEHCHRYSLEEAPGGTAPQYRDSVGARHATVTPTVTQVTGKIGNAADGNASGAIVAPFSGFVNPNSSEAGTPAVGTGVCINGSGNLAIAGFDDNVTQLVGEVIVINKTTGAEISRFSLSAGPDAVQGLTWNNTLGYYAAIGASGSTIYHYDASGTFIGTVSLSGASNCVGWDSVSNCYWSRISTSQLRSYHTTTGATLSTLTLSGISPAIGGWESVSHNPDDDTLLLTSQEGYIYWIHKSTGAQISSFRGVHDQEHAAWDSADDAIWTAGDARFHSFAQLGENVVYKLTHDGQPYEWRSPTTEYSLEWWHKPDVVTTTTTVLAWWSAVSLGGMYAEVQVRATGVMRCYESDVTFFDTAGSTVTTGDWQYFRLTYDRAATTLTLYRNGVQVGQNTSAVFDVGPDGRFSIGARCNSTLPHNGALDDVRLHSSKRSAAWWDTRYNNSNAPATFATVGTPQDAGAVFQAAWALGSNVVLAGAA